MTSVRRPRRFFSQESLEGGHKTVCLSPEESQHLRQILRLNPGDKCLVLDAAGIEAEAVIQSFRPDGCALLGIKEVSAPARRSGYSIHLCVAIPKGVKFEYLIQKAQEIGVSSLTPLMTERTVVRLDVKKESPKQARWLKIAQEAAKQSGNGRVLDLGAPVRFLQIMKDFPAGGGAAVVFHPSPESVPLRRCLTLLEENEMKDLPLKVFVGPEGGFSKKEIEMLKAAAAEHGWTYYQVSLGNSILKVDTAVIAAAAILKLWGESGTAGQ